MRLLRGELIKAFSTRTIAGYALTGVALTIANVVVVTQFSGDLELTPHLDGSASCVARTNPPSRRPA